MFEKLNSSRLWVFIVVVVVAFANAAFGLNLEAGGAEGISGMEAMLYTAVSYVTGDTLANSKYGGLIQMGYNWVLGFMDEKVPKIEAIRVEGDGTTSPSQ